MTTGDDDPSPADPRELMAEGMARLVAGVEELGAAWVVRVVTNVVDLWAGLDATARAETIAAAGVAGAHAAARVAAELRALGDLEPTDQRVTPLELVRSLRREATVVLAAAGVPEVVRDPFDTRAFPDDTYGIVPRSVAELALDETAQAELGGALLAWGLGKARSVHPPDMLEPEG